MYCESIIRRVHKRKERKGKRKKREKKTRRHFCTNIFYNFTHRLSNQVRMSIFTYIFYLKNWFHFHFILGNSIKLYLCTKCSIFLPNRLGHSSAGQTVRALSAHTLTSLSQRKPFFIIQKRVRTFCPLIHALF